MGKLLFGSIIEEYSIKAKTDTNYVVCSVTNTNGFQKSSDTFDKKVFSEDLSAYKKVYRGSFAYNPSRINVGSIGCQNIDECVLVSPLYNIFEVNTDVTTPEFVSYFIRSNYVRNYIKENTQGTVRANFKMSEMSKLHFPNITLDEQKRIIDEFKILEKIIKENEHQLFLYDEFVKSRFIEMFGNLIDTVRLGDCCKVHARIGWQALTTAEHMQTGDYLLITGTDFKDNEVNYSTCKYVAKERYEMDDKIIIRNDDILITKDGTIGKVAIVHNLPKPATLNSGIFVVRPDQRFNKEYISYVFRGPLFDEFVEKTKTGATIKHLNQGHLINFLIPLPSIEEQISFANFSIQINKLKFIVEEQLKLMNELLNKKMDEYFN